MMRDFSAEEFDARGAYEAMLESFAVTGRNLTSNYADVAEGMVELTTVTTSLSMFREITKAEYEEDLEALERLKSEYGDGQKWDDFANVFREYVFPEYLVLRSSLEGVLRAFSNGHAFDEGPISDELVESGAHLLDHILLDAYRDMYAKIETAKRAMDYMNEDDDEDNPISPAMMEDYMESMFEMVSAEAEDKFSMGCVGDRHGSILSVEL
jgi:hypothetical protein